jgi:hypothetical protein
MATLSLKKKKASPPNQIGDKPLENLMGLYAVMRQSHKSKSIRFSCVHETRLEASAEAARLNAESLASRYLIVHIVDHVGE